MPPMVMMAEVETAPKRTGRTGQALFQELAGMANFEVAWARADVETRAFACCISERLSEVPTYTAKIHITGRFLTPERRLCRESGR
jgi:hypothetical protein